MRSEQNIAALERQREAFNRRDLDAAMEAFDSEAEWQMAREDPDASTLQGTTAIRRLWESWLEAYPDLRVDAREVIPAGGRVLAWVRISGRGAGSGVEVTQEEAYVYTFDNGKIVRVEEYFDRTEAFQAAGVAAGEN